MHSMRGDAGGLRFRQSVSKNAVCAAYRSWPNTVIGDVLLYKPMESIVCVINDPTPEVRTKTDISILFPSF